MEQEKKYNVIEPQRIDPEADHFTVEATGKRFFKVERLSVARYQMFEQIEVMMGFGKTFAGIFDEIGKAMKDINKQQQGEAYVKLYNLSAGIQGKAAKYPFVLRYCSLIFNEEGEDPGVIDEAMITKKIDDWKSLDVEPFFKYAINSLPGFRERSIQLTLAISEKQQPAMAQ
jgi:hypothetical protein